jgi:hypothetical protein
MEHDVISGSCLCGQVSFKFWLPYLFFQCCHCSRCQKNSGSAHAANLLLKIEQFEWLTGQDLVKRYELPSAEYYCTSFCSNCGSAMPWHSRNGRYILVPAGALDVDPGVKPERHIYWGSRAPWYVAPGELPVFDEEP